MLGPSPGLSYRRGGTLINNADRPPVKVLDNLPFPARELLDNRLYVNPVTNRPFTLIKTSRGCPFKCIYCTARQYYGKGWRSRSVENVFREISYVVEAYGIRDFLFHSDTFNLKREFVLELCDRIIKEKMNITWMSNCRADLFDDSLAERMKAAGAQVVSFGIESGSRQMLEWMKKGITKDQARKAIAACKKAGLKSSGYFVLGLPGETRESMQETLDFAIELDPTIAQFFAATPFPGTAFYEWADRAGALTTSDWSRYLHGESDVLDYGNLKSEEILAFKKQAYKKFYYRPGKIFSSALNNLTLLTSWTRLRFAFRFAVNRIRT